MTTITPHLFHCLTCADADRELTFLAALGCIETLVVRRQADPRVVEHAELRWGDTGGIMLGSLRETGDTAGACSPGQGRCYLVVPTDADVDARYAAAMAAGATSIEAPTDQPYGGRGATIADPEGNQWSLGSYPGQ